MALLRGAAWSMSALVWSSWMCAGESLSKLVEWLKAGSIEREAGLLKALAQAPLPKKLPSQGFAFCPGTCIQQHIAVQVAA